jgi:hypothetical protein
LSLQRKADPAALFAAGQIVHVDRHRGRGGSSNEVCTGLTCRFDRCKGPIFRSEMKDAVLLQGAVMHGKCHRRHTAEVARLFEQAIKEGRHAPITEPTGV